jgi:hypothetical protein
MKVSLRIAQRGRSILIGLAVICSPQLCPAQSPLIVYEGVDPMIASNSALYEVNPDGTGRQLLNVNIAGIGNPRWSRDGQMITAAGVRQGRSALDVFTFPSAGGVATPVTNFASLIPAPIQVWSAFSPEGQRLVVNNLFVNGEGNNGQYCFTSSVYGMNGALVAQVGHSCERAGAFAYEGWGVDWSPKADLLVLPVAVLESCPGAASAVAVTEIVVVPARSDGFNQGAKLTPHCSNTFLYTSLDYDISPVFSPDGSQVAFVRLTVPPLGTMSSSIRITDGKNERQLVSFPGEFTYGISWSPDGSQLLFDRGSAATLLTSSLPQFGSKGLWTINTNGSGLRQVPVPTPALAPSWYGGAVSPVSTGPGTTPFSVPDRGGVSLTTLGSTAITAGYASIQPNTGSTTPSGIAIFGYRPNDVLISETGVPATPALTSTRVYAEVANLVNTGLAIANPNSSAATITFYYIDSSGNPSGTSGSVTIPAKQQIARFLNQAPFNTFAGATGGAAFQGTLTLTSTAPIGILALRGLTNEQSEFLLSTLPVIDLSGPPNNGTMNLAHFADGGGWTTQIMLVNPTDAPMSGNITFTDPNGAPLTVRIGGESKSGFAYSIPGRAAQKLSTAGAGAATASGSVHVVPANGGAPPAPLVLFSFKPGAVTLSEASVAATLGTAFRVYAESSGASLNPGSIQSGIAISNASSIPATVTFELTKLDGSSAGVAPVSFTLAGSGQIAKLLNDLFPSLPIPFKGVLRITTNSSGLSAVGLRSHVNERGDFLITTTPPTAETARAPSTPLLLPDFLDGGGYTTQIILFSGFTGQTAAGTVQLFSYSGQPLTATFR